MLAKKQRLPIQEFFRQRGMLKRSRFFLAKCFITNKNYSRFGVAVSGKISKSSAARNNIKRIIFNTAKKEITRLPIRDYLIIAVPGIQELSKQELKYELEKFFSQLK